MKRQILEHGFVFFIIHSLNPSPMQLICYAHLRWNFVYQRPQHLLSRFASLYVTYYVEEFVLNEEEDGYYLSTTEEGVQVVVPHLKRVNHSSYNEHQRLKLILNQLFETCKIDRYLFWYYTPMALAFSDHLNPELIIYDCMDELSAFAFAPPVLKAYEKKLLASADIVFTGGNSLYEAKKNFHPNIHSCPSSIDKSHFAAALQITEEPLDQQGISHPRLGFFGVIDERFDIELIRGSALAQPDWQFILIGPIVKIDPASLPMGNNIHYLGSKTYKELPSYLSGWDIALIPFAINEATRFISPTKTPEYLAAGKPVISTPIADVVNPYGQLNLVHIASNAGELIHYAKIELETKDKTAWVSQVEEYLSTVSWDSTWELMRTHIDQAFEDKSVKQLTSKHKIYV